LGLQTLFHILMTNVSYIYPNVASLKQRGGFDERWELAREKGCAYIEIPADFIKNKTEVRATGLDLCAVPGAAGLPQGLSHQ